MGRLPDFARGTTHLRWSVNPADVETKEDVDAAVQEARGIGGGQEGDTTHSPRFAPAVLYSSVVNPARGSGTASQSRRLHTSSVMLLQDFMAAQLHQT